MRSAALAVLSGVVIAGAAHAQTPYAPQAVPVAGETSCPGGLCEPQALEPLFRALAQTEAGGRDRPTHILQLGDSHTAGDRITGAVRARLQARFGRGGRGALPPGPPFAGYRPYQVEMTPVEWPVTGAPLAAGGGGQGLTTWGPTWGATWGLAGARALVAGNTATLTLTADPGREFRALGLCGRGDGVIVEDGSGRREAPLTRDVVVCRRITLAPPSGRIVLAPSDARSGGLELHDLWLEEAAQGVIVSALGVVGATLRDLAARDDAVAQAQLAAWRPDLIVLAYGTNDGFEAIDATAFETLLRGQIERMRSLAPQAALLLLGAPDALRRAPGGRCGGDREPPPGLAVVRDVQRRVAADKGVAFWDWHGRMGGDCSADRLAATPDPLMRGDRVHFTSAGADWIGGVLADDLMAAYDAWKSARQPSSTTEGEGG